MGALASVGVTPLLLTLGSASPSSASAQRRLACAASGEALLKKFNNGHKGKYVCDFGDGALQNHPQFICIPHLGASTEEAEDNCARMAADQIIHFLETGTIKNSVNFPNASLDRQDADHTRLCIINKNTCAKANSNPNPDQVCIINSAPPATTRAPKHAASVIAA